MKEKFNQAVDFLSDFFAYRKGFLPSLGLILIFLNWLLQFFPGLGLFAETNTLLHLGLILAILGFMVAWAL